MKAMQTDLSHAEAQRLREAIGDEYSYQLKANELDTAWRKIASPRGTKYLVDTLDVEQPAVQRLVASVAVGEEGMFAEPQLFSQLREKLIPYLKTFPSVRIWFAGCSTGEGLYGFSIFLRDEGITRFKIYATDISELQLAQACRGVYSLSALKKWGALYKKLGGKSALSEHYCVRGKWGYFKRHLRKDIYFFQHHLASDASFNEFHAVLCRNNLEAFDPALRSRVHNLLFESLFPGGYLSVSAVAIEKGPTHSRAFQFPTRLYQKVS